MYAATTDIASHAAAGGMSVYIMAWSPVIAFVLGVGLFALVILVLFGRV
jgi:roadblock/LC7 domain-containing protein